MLEYINSPTPFIKPFPAFKDVFAEPAELHRKHFLPLVSVDASILYDDLKVWLHFVTPIEPLVEDNIGDWTMEYADFYNRAGQIAFQFCEGKYSFAGDFNFFAYESGAIFKGFPNREEEINAEYRTRIESYERTRQVFLKHGRIPYNASFPWDPTKDACGPLVTQLGGDPVLVNWCGSPFPVNRSGKPFRFIGEVQGFSYCDGGIQAILFFYAPDEQIVLFRFEWT